MRTVVLASLRQHSRRYLAAALAIATGVAFVVVTSLLASSARNGMAAGVDAPYENADGVVVQPGSEVTREVMAEAGDRAAPMAYAYESVSLDGQQLGQDLAIGSVSTAPQLQWQELVAGQWPRGTGEALVDADAAEREGVQLGDVLTVGPPNRSVEVAVVGTATSPSQLDGAPLYLTWPDLDAFGDDATVTALPFVGAEPTVPAGIDIVASDAFVNDLLADLNNQIDAVAMLVLLFAAVALFVAVLVIANTFSILFAQRRADFALLRCLGATPKQVRGSVRLEALLLGVGASLLGVLAGAGLGLAAVAGIRAGFESAPLGAADLSPVWLGGAFLTGLVTTLVAAWHPTRQVLRVSPLAALRPDDSASTRTAAGRIRVGLGILLLACGVGLLGWSIAAAQMALMIAGGMAFFLGVLALGPLLIPALISATGRLLGGAWGAPGRIAASNAVRNPRRTAATTAALLVGVTLTAAVLTGLQTTRTSMSTEMNAQSPIDVALTAPGTFPSDASAGVDAVDGVDAAVAVAGAAGEVAGTPLTVLAPADVSPVVRDDGLLPAPGTVRLPYDVVPGDLGTVTVSVAGQETRLRVTRGEGWGTAALVAPETLAGLAGGDTAPHAVWVRATDGADPETLADDVAAASGAAAEVTDGLGKRSWVELQLDVLAWATVGLLGVGVAIALIGIANTLGLSVLERTRENALLRALGLTRRELRRMLGLEGVLLALVATVVGTVIGVGFAWVGVEVMVAPEVESAPLSLPWLQLGAALAVAVLAGLAAAVLPARRAARIAPAAGLTVD